MMKIEEAMVYLLVRKNGGMTVSQMSSAINTQGLHIRKDGQPVSDKQIWWTVHHYPDTFVYTEGRIFLMI